MGTLKIKVGGTYVPIPRGPKGDTGPANSLGIGTVTSGVTASATITGTPPTQTLNLVLPKGDTGPAGGVNTVDGRSGTVTLSDLYAALAGATFTGRVTLKGISEISASQNSGATTTLDLSAAMTHIVTLTQNTTLAISNVDSGANRVNSVTVILKQDATGGRTVTWPTGTKWPNGVAPVLTTTANATNVVTLMTTDAGTTWLGFLAGAGMA